jgi:hypothetical protein
MSPPWYPARQQSCAPTTQHCTSLERDKLALFSPVVAAWGLITGGVRPPGHASLRRFGTHSRKLPSRICILSSSSGKRLRWCAASTEKWGKALQPHRGESSVIVRDSTQRGCTATRICARDNPGLLRALRSMIQPRAGSRTPTESAALAPQQTRAICAAYIAAKLSLALSDLGSASHSGIEAPLLALRHGRLFVSREMG